MKRLMVPVLTGLAVTVAILALMFVFQRRLMYFPFGHVPTPAEIGLTNVESVAFTTADGLRLEGWFVHSAQLPPRYTVLVFNGNEEIARIDRNWRLLCGNTVLRCSCSTIGALGEIRDRRPR
jgi:hypothetical protein